MIEKIITDDALTGLKKLKDKSVNCVVTSPPYYNLRDYGVDGQIGLERTPEEYIEKLIAVFREVKRVLRDDGTLWINIADTYAGGGRQGNKEMTSENWVPTYPHAAFKSSTIKKDLILRVDCCRSLITTNF